jgi:hypothetical protein
MPCGKKFLLILFFRACLTSPRARLGGIFSALTALKILAIRQDCCGFLPCRAKNLSRQSAHAEILNRLLQRKEWIPNGGTYGEEESVLRGGGAV